MITIRTDRKTWSTEDLYYSWPIWMLFEAPYMAKPSNDNEAQDG